MCIYIYIHTVDTCACIRMQHVYVQKCTSMYMYAKLDSEQMPKRTRGKTSGGMYVYMIVYAYVGREHETRDHIYIYIYIYVHI